MQVVLVAATSFRACHAVFELFRAFVPQFQAAPTPNTVQSWVLRIGLHELTRPKEQADDWVFIVDHTIQLGKYKCLLIVAIRGSLWQENDRPIEHQDLTFLTLEPVETSDGPKVCQQLEAACEQVGVPCAILSDQGSDIVRGVAQFVENHPETLGFADVAYRTATVLKHVLGDDPRWGEFTRECGQAQPKVKQTELGHLAPPTQKTKGRYMNLGPLIGWGVKMLHLVETPESARPPGLDLTRLEEKFGWIREYREALRDWSELDAVKEMVLEAARTEGYHDKLGEGLRKPLESIVQTADGRRMATELLAFIEEQSVRLNPGEHRPASSEVIESFIGKGKRLQGQHRRGGFTKMIRSMAASVVEFTDMHIVKALETVSHSDLSAWCNQNLGVSLTAQRRQALPAPPGTETG